MARNDGRIEPGQKLAGAISARAWNRAQDAADRVLGVGTGFGAGPLITSRLPSVLVTLGEQGWFGQCRFAVNDFLSEISPASGLFPQIPASNNSLSEFSNKEKLIPQYTLPKTVVSGRYGTTFQSSAPSPNNFEAGLFVCVGNASNVYAMSGLAFTRIRVFNYMHRFARNPQMLPEGNQQGSVLDVDGCLDSSFWGLARIVGYWDGLDGDGNFIVRHRNSAGLSYPNFEYRWALIHF